MNFEDKRTLVVISDRDESFKEILALRLEQDKAMRCMSVGIRPEEILHAVREYRPKEMCIRDSTQVGGLEHKVVPHRRAGKTAGRLNQHAYFALTFSSV